MYVKPSNTSPAAKRRADYLRKQAEANRAAHAAVVAATVKPKG